MISVFQKSLRRLTKIRMADKRMLPFCAVLKNIFPSKKYVISIFFRNIALKNNIKGY